MRKILLWMVIAAISISLVGMYSLAGCAPEEIITDEPPVDEPDPVEPEPVEPEPEPDPVEEPIEDPIEEPLEFVCLSKGVHPWFEPAGDGMADAADAIGGINVRYMAPHEFSAEAQTKMMEDLMVEGVDGIGVAVFEAGSMTPVINEAMAMGIPVVIWDDDAADSDRVAFIGTENYEAGVMQGELFADLMDGSANFIIWVQDLAARTVLDRVEGIRSVADQYPDMVELSDVQMAGYGIDEAIPTAETLLDTYPELNATMDVGMNGGAAMSRVMDERNIDQEDILNITWTMEPEVEQGLRDGFIYASMRQNPYAMGYLSTYALKWYLDGLRPTQEFEDMGLHFDSGIVTVTMDNIDVVEQENRDKAVEMVDEFEQLWE